MGDINAARDGTAAAGAAGIGAGDAGTAGKVVTRDAALGAAPAWIAALFAAIDASDAREFAAHFTEDGVFRFGNAPPVVGRAAVEAAVAGFFGSIRGCRHRLLRTWQGDGSWAMDGTVTYLRLDGREVSVPFANVFVMRGERIAQYLIFVDVAPLYAG